MLGKENLERLKRAIQNQVVGEFAPSYFFEAQGLADKKKTLAEKIKDLIEQHTQTKKLTPLEPGERDGLIKQVVDEMLGFGPIDDLMDDDAITEIMINGPNAVYIEKSGKKVLTKVRFKNNQELTRLIHKLVSYAKRKIDETTPYVDVYLEGGTRVNIIIPPLSLDGAAVTIRKHSKNIVHIEDLIKLGTLSKEAAEFLVACVRGKMN
ncbi:MAG: Flp pilus assembly complex ATPase component TadA, partial [Omnitrophica bacterium]|nr:Flp pilus assembly complex ATPase component TadA [Candidatus Omnitrophota bacterium]